MPRIDHRAGLFPALLKYWRGQRGLSQLDLALAADVSNRHVSFLETGRSAPSAEMILRLGTALDVPLRHVNAMLRAAGHEAVYAEPTPGEAWPFEITRTIEMMKAHHDPYPLVVIDRAYNLLDLNAGARVLFGAVVPALAEGADDDMNLVRLTFDPKGAQPMIANFDQVGRELLWRLQREVLADPDDGQLRQLLEDVLAMPTVAEDWRDVDLSIASSPALTVQLNAGGVVLEFVTALTAFQAPHSVALDELRIETWFPCDDVTAQMCRALLPVDEDPVD